MKTSSTLIQSICALICFALPTTQCFAIERSTSVSVATASGNVAYLLDQIDPNQAELVESDSALNSETKTVSAYDKKVEKVLNRLKKGMSHAERAIHRKVSKLSDDEVYQQLQTANLEVGIDARTTLETAYYQKFTETLPALANDIVKSKGLIPYLLKAKKQLKESPNLSDRAPASADNETLCTVMALGGLAIALALILLGCATLGIALFFVCVFPGGMIIGIALRCY